MFLYFFTFIILPNFLDHLFVSLNNESAYISALLIVIDGTCVPTDFVIYICISTDRTDLNQPFKTQSNLLL